MFALADAHDNGETINDRPTDDNDLLYIVGGSASFSFLFICLAEYETDQ